jgi:response regulator NasT
MTLPLRIAVADDERDIREYFQEALPRLGHEVVASAEDGLQLVERCRTVKPDLVLADIRMPRLDGIEAAVAINKERPTPIVLVSAHHDADILNRLGAEPIMGYLIKPITEADLKAAIPVAMLRFRHFMALTKEASDLRQALEDRKLIERAKGILMHRLGVDEDEAFRRLRSRASEQNVKIAELGRRILAAEEILGQFDRT